MFIEMTQLVGALAGGISLQPVLQVVKAKLPAKLVPFLPLIVGQAGAFAHASQAGLDSPSALLNGAVVSAAAGIMHKVYGFVAARKLAAMAGK